MTEPYLTNEKKLEAVVQFSRTDVLGKKSVLLTHRVHPFPFRTRKLSCAVLKILYGRLYGKIGQGRHGFGRGKNSPEAEKKDPK